MGQREAFSETRTECLLLVRLPLGVHLKINQVVVALQQPPRRARAVPGSEKACITSQMYLHLGPSTYDVLAIEGALFRSDSGPTKTDVCQPFLHATIWQKIRMSSVSKMGISERVSAVHANAEVHVHWCVAFVIIWGTLK